MDPLASWRDGPTRAAILDAVARMATEGDPGWVPPAERVAVFDNDGTLWTEKLPYLQCAFLPMGRAAAPPGGQRLHDVHRVGRRPRLHAAFRGRDLRHPAGARDRQP